MRELGCGRRGGEILCIKEVVEVSKVLIWIWIQIHGEFYGSGSGKMIRILWIQIRIRNTGLEYCCIYSHHGRLGFFANIQNIFGIV